MIRKIKRICATFLWKGNLNSAKGVRVSWFNLSFPKAEGGLGVRNLKVWSWACFLQNFWNLMTQAGSLWIAWVKACYVKDRELWELHASVDSSWT